MKKISNPEILLKLADNKKSVFIKGYSCKEVYPAAFVQNWNFRIVIRLLKNGKIYENNKNSKNS
jgi:hypothetical protein